METQNITLTLEISKENLSTGENIYVAEFKEIDLVSQGSTIEEAQQNAVEALSLFIEFASKSELKRRLPIRKKRDVFTTLVELPFGQIQSLVGAAGM